jgi:NADPH2:quinone reductase
MRAVTYPWSGDPSVLELVEWQVPEPAANADLDLAVLRPRGSIAVYANEGGTSFGLDVRRSIGLNARYRFVLLYTVGWDRISAAAADINSAIEQGAFRVGEAAGLPIHRFRLEDAAAAHAAVEGGAVGKVLIVLDNGEGSP